MQKLAVSLDGPPVATLLDRMNPGGWLPDIADVPGGQIGVLSHPDAPVLRAAGIGPGVLRRGDDVLAFSGLPLAPGRIADLQAASGLPEALRTADGAFAAAGWSARDNRLYVACDFLGLQPLYRSTGPGLQIATETKAFAYDPDPAGWGAWLSCGHLMGAATLTRAARRFDPGATGWLQSGGAGALDRQWIWPRATTSPAPDVVLDLLAHNVRDYAAVADNAVCLLSGGFDSRLILGLLQRTGTPTRALIVRHQDQHGDQDGLLALAVARAAGVACDIATPSAAFFSSRDYLDYVWANEAAIPSLDLFIANVYAALGNAPVWEGLIPAHTLRTVHQPTPGTFATFAQQECAGEDSGIWRAARSLFTPAFYDSMRSGFADLFAQTRAGYPDDTEGMWQWLIEHRMRNRTGPNPAKVYANRAAPLMVGTSQAFWQAVAAMPYADRLNYRYYLDLFTQAFPALAAIPFDSSGDLYACPQARLARMRWEGRQAFHRFFSHRPNLACRLGIHVYPQERSAFLARTLAAVEDDALLNMDTVQRLRMAPARDRTTASLLFHWQAARWIHDGQLHTRLQPA